MSLLKLVPPPVAEIAGSLVKGVVGVVAPAMVASDDVQRARVAICRACPHVVRQGPSERCGICHCPIESKTALARESCPDRPSRWS